MSPPLKEGDQAISRQNGTNPFPISPENSFERIINSEFDPQRRTNFLKQILITAFGTKDEVSEGYTEKYILNCVQRGLGQLLNLKDLLKNKGWETSDSLKEKSEFLDHVIDLYAVELFLSPIPPKFSEISKLGLDLIKERLDWVISRSKHMDIYISYKSEPEMNDKERQRLADLVYFAFRSDTDKTYKAIAKNLLTILELQSRRKENKTTFVKDLIYAVNLYKEKGNLQKDVRDWLRRESRERHFKVKR